MANSSNNPFKSVMLNDLTSEDLLTFHQIDFSQQGLDNKLSQQPGSQRLRNSPIIDEEAQFLQQPSLQMRRTSLNTVEDYFMRNDPTTTPQLFNPRSTSAIRATDLNAMSIRPSTYHDLLQSEHQSVASIRQYSSPDAQTQLPTLTFEEISEVLDEHEINNIDPRRSSIPMTLQDNFTIPNRYINILELTGVNRTATEQQCNFSQHELQTTTSYQVEDVSSLEETFTNDETWSATVGTGRTFEDGGNLFGDSFSFTENQQNDPMWTPAQFNGNGSDGNIFESDFIPEEINTLAYFTPFSGDSIEVGNSSNQCNPVATSLPCDTLDHFVSINNNNRTTSAKTIELVHHSEARGNDATTSATTRAAMNARNKASAAQAGLNSSGFPSTEQDRSAERRERSNIACRAYRQRRKRKYEEMEKKALELETENVELKRKQTELERLVEACKRLQRQGRSEPPM